MATETQTAPLENAPAFEPTVTWMNEAAVYYGQSALDNLITFAPRVLAALLVLWIGVKIARRVSTAMLKWTTKNEKIDTTLGSFFSASVRYVILIGALLLAVTILGANVASILGIFAAMTLAIGLALQGSMSNVAAGLLLIILRPYQIGDYVEVAGEEGTVEDLSIFATTLRTLDNIKIIVSNGEVRGGNIKNLTTMGERRVDIDFGIDYGDDINKAIKIITSTAAKDDRIIKTPNPPWAKVSCLNDSSVDIQLRVWCKAADYWDVRFDMLKAVKEAFDKGGISIPYPHVVEITKSE
ncbi:MAG: mechanosensitive ion channel family protein [Alphaproteobacteria bacterium]